MTRTSDSAIKDLLQVVTFRLAGEEYALEITKVKEVILPAGITRVPQMPDCIVGIINLRGNVIPVVDLRTRFHLGERKADEQTRILIAKPSGRTVGFIVDAVSQVLKISRGDLQTPPETIAGIAQKYLRGIAKLGDERMILLLDVEAILDPSELAALVA